MKALFSMALLLVVAGMFNPVRAQELTKNEEGNVALGQCYSGCMDIYQGHYEAYNAKLRWIEDWFAAAVQALSQDYIEGYLDHDDYLECDDLRMEIRTMEACNVQCINVNEAYPNSSSSVKARFLTVYNAWKGDAVSAGLWTSYADSPAFGSDAFDTACDLYWYGPEGASAAREGQSAASPVWSSKAEKQRMRRRLFGGE